MPLSRGVVVLALLLVPFATAFGQGGDRIEWASDLTSGLAKAKASGLVLMICVNAKRVDGRRTEEPAAKGLREVVYRDPRIVAKSREFVCVLITPTSNVMDYGELRSLGIDGDIVSPQHIFVTPEGDRIVHRHEYWSYGKGDRAVEALLEMMEKAQSRAKAPAPAEVPQGEGQGAPADAEARKAWIEDRLMELDGTIEKRENALAALVKADKDGDCTTPLIALLPEKKKDADFVWSLIRALGQDGLEAAALPISEFLGHKDLKVRGCAAVSLEYIGSSEKKVVTALMKAASRQKDEAVANHMFRALGRCGAEDKKVRAFLLKATASAKSEFASFGPAIGLAYFEKDKAAARGVEEMLKRIGVPGGRRGAGQNTVKRALLSWTLASIGDPKSADFVREELIAPLENMQAFWVKGIRDFWVNVARVCEGETGELPTVEGGVRFTAGIARQWGWAGSEDEPLTLMDDSRTGRENVKFRPKGDGILGGSGE